MRFFLTFSLVVSFLTINSQVTTTVNPTIAQLVQKLSGNGITINNFSLTCSPGAYALYSGGTGQLATLSSGILLTTGSASNVAGPNNVTSGTNNSYPGSVLGDTLNGQGPNMTHDACYLTFLLTPACNTLSINYVFASNEYSDYVSNPPTSTSINDVFGFVIDGPNPSGGNYVQTNIATIPGSTLAVSIQNVNNGTGSSLFGTPPSGPCMNCAYFQDAPPGMVYNGSTTVLTASTAVTPCQQYTMTIGVWDVADGSFDSGVFLDVNGLSCAGSPTITATVSPSMVCGPQTVTLTATGGIASSSYTWSAPASGGLVSTTGTVVTANPTGTTTYTLAYSDVNSCLGLPTIKTTVITFTPLPSFPVMQTPSSPICLGQTATLTANAGAGTYTWMPSATLSSSSGSVVVASPTTNTTYTVIHTAGTCTNSSVTTVTVTSTAPISVTPSSTTICSGQNASLASSGSGPFAWTASSGANPPNTATVVVSPTVNTTYTVISGAGTCTSSAVSNVSVSPAFTLTATPSTTTICGGGSGANLSVSGGSTYTWAPAGSLNVSNGANVIATPSTTTNYTITGSNGLCTRTVVATVSVSIVNATVTASSLNYCNGAPSVTLTGSGGTTYAWSPAAGLSSTVGAVVTATPALTTVYSVTATTGSCSSVKTVTITVPPTNSLSIAASSTLICAGSTSTLTGSGATTYTWIPGSVMTSTNAVSPLTTSSYTLTGRTAAGCYAVPAVITVSVMPAITPTLVASSATVCLTKTISINATPTGAGISYTWAPSSAIVGSVNSSSIIAKPTTTATVIYTLTLSNGLCVSSKTISIQVVSCIPPTANFFALTNDTICTNGCVTFSAVATGAAPITYQWLVPGGTPSSTTQASPQICFNTAGSYTIALIATNPYGTDTVIKPNYIFVADTPNVVRAFGDTLIKIGQTAPISVVGGTTYYWTPNNGTIACPTCSNTIVQPTVTTQYIVTAYNTIYCSRQDTITVSIDATCGDFFVPNVFSPNGDGLNDYVTVSGFCISTFTMRIYSRWGEKVFESKDKSYGWDGTFRGKTMDTGVFVYEVDGVTILGKDFTIKGNITLLR